MRASLPIFASLLVLSSCGSPPKPPTVDESRKRPVNSQMAVELQVCRNDLHNTRILASESGRLADTTSATLANMAATKIDRKDRFDSVSNISRNTAARVRRARGGGCVRRAI